MNEGSRCGDIYFWWLKRVFVSTVGNYGYCCYAGSCYEKLRSMNATMWRMLCTAAREGEKSRLYTTSYDKRKLSEENHQTIFSTVTRYITH